ncbi:MAG: hypothetical protein IKM31_05095 [Oscillospiraceae bacterium]|nr:hypothetical protein [Oscillospiraceae bacterium]
MEKMQLQKIASVIGASSESEALIEKVIISPEEACPGSLYFELQPGTAGNALLLGASAAVSREPGPGRIVVPDPMDALEKLAAWHRKLFHTWILGITGSIGKTTVKEMAHAVLTADGPTVKTRWDIDREAGLPLALLDLSWADKNAVLEVGFTAPGSIARMSRIMRPSAALITSVGIGHLSQCGSREALLSEKLAVTEGMNPSAPLIINGDDDMLQHAYEILPQEIISYGVENPAADFRGKVLEESLAGSGIEVSYYGRKQRIFVPKWGRAGVYNALAAFTAGIIAGIEPEVAAERIAAFTPAPHRQSILKFGDITVLDDSCSASPESVREALRLLGELPAKRRIAVLGEMPDLGSTAENAHRAIGRRAAQCGADLLCCVGEHAPFTAEEASRMGNIRVVTFKDTASLATYLSNDKRPGDTVLVKGDAAQHMEKIIAAVWEEKP